MNENILTLLKGILENGYDPTEDYDFNARDYSGGNFDDAFHMGVEVGKIKLAKQLLNLPKGVRMK